MSEKTSKKPEKGSYVDKAVGEQPKPATRPVRVEEVKAGHLMAFLYYAKVLKVDAEHFGNPRVHVEGLVGAPKDFYVHGKELIESAFSADQYSAEEKVTKTRAAEILSTAYNRPFTVCFEKQDGKERVLRGRLIEPEPLLGRSHVEDLDVVEGHKLRLVDHRTIHYIIVDCVKYVVK
jgi:hypothetical protein